MKIENCEYQEKFIQPEQTKEFECDCDCEENEKIIENHHVSYCVKHGQFEDCEKCVNYINENCDCDCNDSENCCYQNNEETKKL